MGGTQFQEVDVRFAVQEFLLLPKAMRFFAEPEICEIADIRRICLGVGLPAPKRAKRERARETA
jgi:hypothetical protein